MGTDWMGPRRQHSGGRGRLPNYWADLWRICLHGVHERVCRQRCYCRGVVLKQASSDECLLNLSKLVRGKSISAIVLATSSRVIRNHSFRVADRGQQSKPSRIETSEQMPSRMLAITPDLARLKAMGKPDNEGIFHANGQK